jgi:ParB/Sulfiredoxin domain
MPIEKRINIDLKTDPELVSLMTPLTADEKRILEESILKEGYRDPLCVWDGVIVDGHHRYEICKRHGLPFVTLPYSFSSKAEAKIWMILNQAGRRNLEKYQKAMLYGPTLAALEHELAKERQQATFGRASLSETWCGNIATTIDETKGKARDIAGEKLGVSGRMISDAETIQDKAPELVPKVMSCELPIDKAA